MILSQKGITAKLLSIIENDDVEPQIIQGDRAAVEASLQELLFEPLVDTIFGGDTNLYNSVLNTSLSGVCGRMLRNGDLAYTCITCGADNTCVMCDACFTASEHVNHNYKMHASTGGGYCDCGDTEAWKEHPTCRLHLIPATTSVQIPSDVFSRCEQFIMAAIPFTYDLFMGHEQSFTTERYYTIVLNDETHSFDDVMACFKRALSCDGTVAKNYACIIDREGRAVVYNHIGGIRTDAASCNSVCDAVKNSYVALRREPLNSAVISRHLYLAQEISVYLLRWITRLVEKNVELQRLLFTALDSLPPLRIYQSQEDMELASASASILRSIVVSDSRLWKNIRQAYHNLVLTSCISDVICRQQFAVVYMEHYETIVRNYLSDDHNYNDNVLSLAVQLLTVPTVSLHLVTEHDALAVAVDALKSHIVNALGGLRNVKSPTPRRNWMYLLMGIRYIMSSLPDPSLWTTKTQDNFMKGAAKMLEIFQAFDGMDAVQRQTGQHVEWERDFVTGLEVQRRLTPIANLIINRSAAIPRLLEENTVAVMEGLFQVNYDLCEALNVEEVEMCGHSINAVVYDVGAGSSMHRPISRLATRLMLERTKITATSTVESLVSADQAMAIFESASRTLVMTAQVSLGMWRRNGYSIQQQVMFYRPNSISFKEDIISMQLVAAALPPDDFIVQLANKFGLLNWSLGNDADSDDARFVGPLLDEFLLLFCWILTERYVDGIAEHYTEENALSISILQHLAARPLSFAKVLEYFTNEHEYFAVQTESVIETALHKVGVIMPIRKYEVRPEELKNFNPFCYMLSKDELTKAEEVVSKKRKSSVLEEPLFSPPLDLPAFTAPFSPINQLLKSAIMQKIWFTIFTKVWKRLTSQHQESHVDKVFFLLVLGLREEAAGRLAGFSESLTNNIVGPEGDQCTTLLGALQRVVSCDSLSTHQKAAAQWLLKKLAPVPAAEEKPESSGDAVGISAAAKRQRDRILASMKRQQARFMEENNEMFEANAGEAAEGADEDEDGEVVLRRNTCVFCYEKSPSWKPTDTKVMIMYGHMERSGLLTNVLGPQVHFVACAHVMHNSCYLEYCQSQSQARRRLSSTPSVKCPLCKSVTNTALPLIALSSALATLPAAHQQSKESGGRHLLSDSLAKNEDDLANRYVAPSSPPLGGLGERTVAVYKAFLVDMQGLLYVKDATTDAPQYWWAPATVCRYTLQSLERRLELEQQPLLSVSGRDRDSFICLTNAAAACFVSRIGPFSPGILRDEVCNLMGDYYTILTYCWLQADVLRHFYSLHRTEYDIFIRESLELSTLLAVARELLELKYHDPSAEVEFMDASLDRSSAAVAFSESRTPLQQFFSELRPEFSRVPEEEVLQQRIRPAIVQLWRFAALIRYLLWNAEPPLALIQCLSDTEGYVDSLGKFIFPSGDFTSAASCLTSICSATTPNNKSGSFRDFVLSMTQLLSATALNEPGKSGTTGRPVIRTIISLPKKYTDLMQIAADFVCPTTGGEARHPTMCLLCGEILCSSSYCCNQETENVRIFTGAVFRHSRKCPEQDDKGMFLRIREARVICISGNRLAYENAPYVDKHGEPDTLMRRGVPTFFSKPMYDKLAHMWTSHGLAAFVAKTQPHPGQLHQNHLGAEFDVYAL